jgi:hypothetical protein
MCYLGGVSSEIDSFFFISFLEKEKVPLYVLSELLSANVSYNLFSSLEKQ